MAGQKSISASQSTGLPENSNVGIHCFVKTINQEGTVLDSKDFFGDQDSYSES